MRILPLVLLAPASLAVALVAACAGDESASGGSAGDAGAARDAGVTAPGAAEDAAPALADATAPDTVSVVVSGSEIAGAEVVFHDAAGSVIGRTQTDAAGKASRSAEGVAMVTVVQTRSPRMLATTFTNVAAGDVLAVKGLEKVSPVGSFVVSVPALTGGSAAGTVRVGTCSAAVTAGGTVGLNLRAECVGATPTSVLATDTIVRTGETRFAFTRQGPAAPTDGSPVGVTIPGPWVAPATTEIRIGSFPPGATLGTVVWALAGGLVFPYGAGATPGPSITHGYAPGFGEALQATVSFVSDRATTYVSKRYPLGGEVAIDWGTALPLLGAVTIDTSRVARPRLTWSGTVPGADGERAGLVWAGPDRLGRYWNFVLPPGTEEVTAPELPADLGFALAADAGVPSYTASVTEIEADAFADAAAFRTQQGKLLAPMFGAGNVIPGLPANGAVRISVIDGHVP